MEWLASIVLLVSLAPALSQAGWQFETDKLDQFCQLGDQNVNCRTEPKPKVVQDCFTGAVLEHIRKDLSDSHLTAEANLQIYERASRLAKSNGANIIVFPEDGIVHGTRKFTETAAENIPDPKLLNVTNNNPCLQSEFYGHNKILQRLSCIARDNNLYVVANFPTKQACDLEGIESNQVCPKDGQLLLNTDVVLDPQGNYIGRYRKYNLFIEIFDKAPSMEAIYFDTPYGRFGVFTCFDMMFKRPAIELVEKYNIDTAIFPTWWYDELPLLTAPQFQDGWSLANNVNLLASNMHRRELGSVGSGIYSAKSSIYTTAKDPDAKLLIATIPTKYSGKCSKDFNAKAISLKTEDPIQKYNFITYALLPTDNIYILKSKEDTKTVCSGRVCCTLSYKISGQILSHMVLIVRDSPRRGVSDFNWYEQLCTVATLAKPFNLRSINETEFAPATSNLFEVLSLTGTFSTNHVYPIAAHSINQLVQRNDRSFTCFKEKANQYSQACQMTYTYRKATAIYSFGLYGRDYDADKMPPTW